VRRLRIVGSEPAEPSPRSERGPGEPAPGWTVFFDVRGGARDRELLAALRTAGVTTPVLLASVGAVARLELPPELGPGVEVRAPEDGLVPAIFAEERAPVGLAIGAGAARALRAGRVVRVDGGVPGPAQATVARGLSAHLTLRDPLAAVLAPLALGASPARLG